MTTVKTGYIARAREVKIYYAFLNRTLKNETNDDLKKILKSNLILMLYNLVESTMTNAIDEIHSQIHSQSTSFDVLREELKKQLIDYLKSHISSANFVASVSEIAKDIVSSSFYKEKLFSGNIDGKKIKEFGAIYGFSCDTQYVTTGHGGCLLTIKSRRNDLAHGTFSFTEVGKDYSIQDLFVYMKQTIHFLDQLLDNIDAYIQSEGYKQLLAPATLNPMATATV